MNWANYAARLTKLESAQESQGADDGNQFWFWLQTIFQVDPVVEELLRHALKHPEDWLESPQAEDPLFADLVEFCRSEDRDEGFHKLMVCRAKRARTMLGMPI